MVSVYRYCIAILFASLSFSIAQECSVSSCQNSTNLSCIEDDGSIYSFTKQVTEQYLDESSAKAYLNKMMQDTWFRDVKCYDFESSNLYLFGWSESNCSGRDVVAYRTEYTKKRSVYENKALFCSIKVDPSPDPGSCSLASCVANNNMLDANSACYLVGREVWYRPKLGESEFYCLMNDDPIDPTDPDKPTDPTDPTDPDKPTDPTDPTDPDKPTDPGGSDNGSGNGNNPGNGGSGNGNNSGNGLTKNDVRDAVKDALDLKGKELDSKLDGLQSDMSREGNNLLSEGNSMIDSALSGLVIKRDIKDFEKEYIFEIDAPKVCPEPYILDLGSFTIPIPFDIFCKFSELIGYLVLASAYISAIYIIMGLRRV